MVFYSINFIVRMTMATSSTEENNDDTYIDKHVNGGGYSLVLTNERISVSRRGQEISRILLEDVLGVEMTHGKGLYKAEMIVHGFPKTKKLFRGETRWRTKIIHRFDSEESTESERLSKQWKRKIIIESRKVIQKKFNWYYKGRLNY